MLVVCQLAKLNIGDSQLMADNKDVVKACENLLALCVDFHKERLSTIDISKPECMHELLVQRARIDGMKTLAADFAQAWVRETKR